GDDAQLAKLAARLFAQPLDRTRPLWEVHLIDGYRGDRSVLVCKVHHCMIDGVSGVQLLNVMFDPSPKPTPLPPPDGLLDAPPPAPPAPPRGGVPAPPPPPSGAPRLRRGARYPLMRGPRPAGGAGTLPRHRGGALAELGAATDSMMEMGRIFLGPKPSTPFN